MLVIRNAQVSVFDEALSRAFAERVADFLLEHVPDECEDLARDALLTQVLVGIDVARGFGISSELGLVEFIIRLFTVGPRFYDHSDVRSVLTDSSIDPDDRPGFLSIRLSSEQMRAAGRLR